MNFKKLQFDSVDILLIDRLEELENSTTARNSYKNLFTQCFHPRGIKELTAPSTVRLTLAMLNLLDDVSDLNVAIDQRVRALKMFHDELFNGLNGVALKYNAARVILQIMKDMIREKRREIRLRLAHDLQTALLGQSRFIRKMLDKYHLLEMPEERNQISFDDHVHDVNSKGRKTPSQLVMDAWIKGLNSIQVVYYNYVPVPAAEELLKAGNIMGVQIRICVEYCTVFRGKYVELLATPRGFSGITEHLKFLQSEKLQSFRQKELESANFRQKQIIRILQHFNKIERLKLNEDFCIDLVPICEKELRDFVRHGQLSIEHLAELISHKSLEILGGNSTELTSEIVKSEYLKSKILNIPPSLNKLPSLSKLLMPELIDNLHKMHTNYNYTLNLSNLTFLDVVELIYDCKGAITHLEIFNLKDSMREDDQAINEFRTMLNNGDVISLKALLQKAFVAIDEADLKRIKKFKKILSEISKLMSFYKHTTLGCRLGSDSAGRAKQTHGMGFAITDTLPKRTQKKLNAPECSYVDLLPLKATFKHFYQYPNGNSKAKELNVPDDVAGVIDPAIKGNVVALGKLFYYHKRPQPLDNFFDNWNYLNIKVKLFIKILVGFLLGAATFYFTNSWWFLMWFGAPIWLGITCVRNILQSVLGGGGFRIPQLMRWSDFVSWTRVADSLFYTGLSVPFLELVCRKWLLLEVLDLTPTDHPVLVFTILAMTNGAYIGTHNLWRGLSKWVIVANMFRPVLAVPVAVGLSFLLSNSLGIAGVVGVAAIMEQLAAIISKLSSDIVGGLIEGYADGRRNLSMRIEDYKSKMVVVFHTIEKLEILYPTFTSELIFSDIEKILTTIEKSNPSLARDLVINALDLLYFRMSLPKADVALRKSLSSISPEWRVIYFRAMEVLVLDKNISHMLLSGVAGKNYKRILNFYLSYAADYMKKLKTLVS